jgi:hypothetical protein
MAEYTPEELATINEIMSQESGSRDRQMLDQIRAEQMQQSGEAMAPEEKEILARILRLNSSAELSNEEIRQGKQQFFGMPGDPPEVLQDKASLRQMMLREESGAAMTPEEMQMQMRQQSGAAATPQEMQGTPTMAEDLRRKISEIKARMGGGAPQTGSQRVMDAMGALPAQQAGSAMTPEEMQQLQMMRGQR